MISSPTVISLFLPLAINAVFGRPEDCFSLAIMAFGACERAIALSWFTGLSGQYLSAVEFVARPIEASLLKIVGAYSGKSEGKHAIQQDRAAYTPLWHLLMQGNIFQGNVEHVGSCCIKLEEKVLLLGKC